MNVHALCKAFKIWKEKRNDWLMKAVFLADTHLKNADDDGYHSLMHFFDHMATVDHLFIAGDFFDFWFCRNGRVYPEFSPVIDKLVDLKQRGVHIILCEGNHDFFMESFFSESLGMTVFTEWASIDLDGRRILVSHGDTVDETNRRYLLLRKILRSRMFYRIQRNIPLFLLWKIARLSSMMSKELLTESENWMAEKMEAFSQEKFKEGFDAVILGHCHKPLIREYVMDGRKRTFATLGDWVKHRSYLYYEDGRFTLNVGYPGWGDAKLDMSGRI
jgi:UDP-2,3-diacylglucosamine hydrolase